MAPLIPQPQTQGHLSTSEPATMPTASTTPHSHPATPSEAAQAHTALLQQLDLNSTPRPFRNPSWKPPQRRNKTVKQILADQARRDALALAASANAANAANAAGAGSNNGDGTGIGDDNNNNTTEGAVVGEENGGKEKPKVMDTSTKAATYKMSTLAIERRAAAAVAAAKANNTNNNNNDTENNSSDGMAQTKTAASSSGPIPTYTNIESAPSLHPASRRHYCDVTGLSAPYRDPKTRLRYHNGEVFGLVRTLGTQAAEAYLEARGAHTVLK